MFDHSLTQYNSILARSKAKWKNPSGKNDLPDFTKEQDFEDIWEWMDSDNMVRAPGVIPIPICSLKEIQDNWRTSNRDWYSWPCDKP